MFGFLRSDKSWKVIWNGKWQIEKSTVRCRIKKFDGTVLDRKLNGVVLLSETAQTPLSLQFFFLLYWFVGTTYVALMCEFLRCGCLGFYLFVSIYHIRSRYVMFVGLRSLVWDLFFTLKFFVHLLVFYELWWKVYGLLFILQFLVVDSLPLKQSDPFFYFFIMNN